MHVGAPVRVSVCVYVVFYIVFILFKHLLFTPFDASQSSIRYI